MPCGKQPSSLPRHISSPTLIMFVTLFKDWLSLCYPGWLGSLYVEKAGLELVAILLPLFLED